MTLGPGIHRGVPAAAYPGDPAPDPSLSSSIAKTLLKRTPRHAWHEHPRLNPAYAADDEAKFDIGSVAHELLLGKGSGFEIIEAEDWRTKAAQEARKAARAAGKTPILDRQHGEALFIVDAVTERLMQIPECAGLFTDGAAEQLQNGQAETVLIWQDIGGPWCRAMIGWWGPTDVDVWDFKTTDAGLSDAEIRRTIFNLGYDLSAAFYIRGLTALRPELAGRFRWRWIFAETKAPYEVRVISADPTTLTMGDRRAALAIAKWHRCMTSGEWPGYAPDVSSVGYPEWAEGQWLDRELADEDAGEMVPLSGPMPSRKPEQFTEIAP